MQYLKKNSTILSLFIAALIAGCSFSGGSEPVFEDTNVPFAPNPQNNAFEQSVLLTLSWSANNFDKYDIYVDTQNPPQLLYASNVDVKNVTVAGLNYSSTYYWRVVGKRNDGTSKEGPVWKFTTRSQAAAGDGFLMLKHNIETYLPNYVSIMFQVFDGSGKGVDDLTTTDFDLLENGQPISPSESSMQIRKRDQVPYKLKTVLLLDNSTSLRNNINEVRTAANTLVDNLLNQQEMAIYSFSDQPLLLQDFTSNKTQLKNALNNYVLGYATTDLYGAVEVGASRWEDLFSGEEITQGVMILFTDGRDTQSPPFSLSDAVNAIGNKKVYSIGLGTEINPDILETIGTAGFYSIADVNQLTDKFIEIQDDILFYANSFYVMVYSSPKQGDFDHALVLRIKDNPYSGSGSFISATYNSKNFRAANPGVYVNTSPDKPEGIIELNLSINESRILQAITIAGTDTPSYTWTTNDERVITVAADTTDNSRAVVKAVGFPGQAAFVTVTDTVNNYNKAVLVSIQQ